MSNTKVSDEINDSRVLRQTEHFAERCTSHDQLSAIMNLPDTQDRLTKLRFFLGEIEPWDGTRYVFEEDRKAATTTYEYLIAELGEDQA